MFPSKNDASRWITAALALTVLGFLGWFWRLSVADENILFLEEHTPAQWILYPKPPDAREHPSSELQTVFHRSFELNAVPKKAVLSVRGMKRWSIALNQALLEPAAQLNWKQEAEFDVTAQLHSGNNEINVAVFNSDGPPALWLVLDVDELQFVSNPDWDASLLGAAWRKARAASSFPMELGKGNSLSGGELPRGSLLYRFPTLVMFDFLSIALLACGLRWRWIASPRVVYAALILLWIVLFWNNLRLLPYQMGFDALHHLDYVNDINHGHLPLANEGYQKYQPPLYYLLAALIRAPFHPADFGDVSTQLLRLISPLAGAIHFTLVFLCLRLLFPGRLGLQVFGLILAALIPENLYISHYISNESLSAMLTTAAIYFCLRILKEDRDSPWLHAALGLCLGAALLAKVTGIIAVPFISAALLGRHILKRQFQPQTWLRTVGLAGALAFAVCGWHYLRVWRHFGHPLVGNWDAVSGLRWWMEDGFHVRAYFFRFGQCFVYPWYSGFHSFADGLYSTLWGDALGGGTVDVSIRPQWNYELMAAGYLLALLPTLLIFTGAIRALTRFIRKPDLTWFLLIGIAGGMLAALIYMSLKVPNYGEVKAFYGLIALVPLCAFGALGWDIILRLGKHVFIISAILFGMWALNSYASYWICSWNPQTLLAQAWMENVYGSKAKALQLDAKAWDLSRFRSNNRFVRDLLDPDFVASASQLPEPRDELIERARLHPLETAMQMLEPNPYMEVPDDAESHLLRALVLDKQGQLVPAIAEAQRAMGMAPDDPHVYETLCDLLIKQGSNKEAVAAGQKGLCANPLDASLHYKLGQAFGNLADDRNAAVYLRYAVQLKPDMAEAHELLGLSLLGLKQSGEALAHFSRALELRPNDAVFHYNFALGLGAAGKTAEAIAEYRRALELKPDYPAALNNLARILATDANAQLRNGTEAVQLARRACELTGRKSAVFLATLAAAYAEAGQFAEAVAATDEAIALARATGDEKIAVSLVQWRELYRANQPYHESAAVK